jgi:hypothetical protein
MAKLYKIIRRVCCFSTFLKTVYLRAMSERLSNVMTSPIENPTTAWSSLDVLRNMVAVVTLPASALRAPTCADCPAVHSQLRPVIALWYTRTPHFSLSLTLTLS